MKKHQILKFWKALDDSTSIKKTVSSFKGKKGYGKERTLVRLAQAAKCFREDLESKDIAGKTGWSLVYVDKLRSYWEQKRAEQAQVEQEPLKGAPHEQRYGNRESMVVLIRKWRTELESYAPVQIARLWLEDNSREAVRDFLSNEESKRLFHEAQRTHFENQMVTGIRLGVESDRRFRLLRQKLPSSGAWAQLDVWKKQVTPYLDAHWSLLDELEITARCFLDREDLFAGEAALFLVTRRLVCLWALAMACNLLAKGLGELPGNVRHGLLIAELSKLQAEVDLEILLLSNRTSKGGPATDMERIWTDSEDVAGLVQRTRDLISEWLRLQSTQDSLLIAIQEMEDSV